MSESLPQFFRRLAGFFAAVTVVAGCAISIMPTVEAETGARGTNPSLAIKLETDKSAYSLPQKITARIILTNTSNAPIYIYGPVEQGESASVSLWLKNAKTGEGVAERFIADSNDPPPRSKEQFIKLAPNEPYTVSIIFDLTDWDIRSSGTYDLVAQYHSPVPSSLSLGLPIWSREFGTLSSNHVTIEIDDPK